MAYDIELKVDINRYFIVEIDGDDVSIFEKETTDTTFEIDFEFNLEEIDTYDYPSWKKVNNWISSGDIKWLRMVIDATIKSQNDCEGKESFLNGLLNRIERFISSIEKSVENLNKEIRNLEKRKATLNQRRDNLEK